MILGYRYLFFAQAHGGGSHSCIKLTFILSNSRLYGDSSIHDNSRFRLVSTPRYVGET